MQFCFSLVCGWVLMAGAAYAGGGVKSVVRVDKRTGKLVRTVVAPVKTESQKPGTARPPQETAFRDTVARIAAEHSLPPALIDSVIHVESDYNPFAISPKGALGLMQLVPATARRFGVSDVFDPVENIRGGARYLRYLLDLYGGNYTLALAAYNAGEGAVAKYGDVPPYAETRNYVSLVGKEFAGRAPQEQRAAETPAKTSDAQPDAAPEPAHIQAVVEPDGTVRYVTR